MHAVTKPYAIPLELLEDHLEDPETVHTPGMYFRDSVFWGGLYWQSRLEDS